MLTFEEACGILGIPPYASEDEIRRAFHKLAHENHPDKGGDHEKMKVINAAYTIITKYSSVKTSFDAWYNLFIRICAELKKTTGITQEEITKIDAFVTNLAQAQKETREVMRNSEKFLANSTEMLKEMVAIDPAKSRKEKEKQAVKILKKYQQPAIEGTPRTELPERNMLM